MTSKVLYPTTVINHVIDDIAQLSERNIQNAKEIRLYYGSQINNHPHIGTIVSAMSTHALAKHMSDYFNIPSKVIFSGLENEGGIVKNVNGIKYSRMLCDEDINQHNTFLKSFETMFSIFSELSGIETIIESYHDLQEKPLARKTLLEMINKTDLILPLLNPMRDKIGVRYKCPECNYIDKHYKTQELIEFKPDKKAVFKHECFEHGPHINILTHNNKDFFDVNGMVRNVIKEVIISSEAEKEDFYPIIVKGGDWVPTAIMVSEALEELGCSYKKRPQRIFTPLVLDWSGAKFSKSNKEDSENTPREFLSFPEFILTHKLEGFQKLWNEISSWTQDTTKFYRNYTSEYFEDLLKK